MVFLSGFQKIRPDHSSRQSDLHQQLLQDFQRRYSTDPTKLAQMIRLTDVYACKPEYIETRGHEVPHYQSELFEKSEGTSQLQRKVQFYSEKTFDKLTSLYKNVSQAPEVLTHVTCTGYSSPSPTQKLISKNCWSNTTNFHAYHMGCYAAFPAIRMSSAELYRLKASGESHRRADIFHSELSSLHFDRDRLDPEQMVVQTLFADGYMKYCATLEDPNQPGFQLLSIEEQIIPDSLEMMTWDISEPGFHMTLSRHVPTQIKKNLSSFVEKLMSKSPIRPQKESLLFAIHPGGPKIINEIQELLSLSTEQVQHCRQVLKTHGNMSSATLPTVWHSLLEDPKIPTGQLIITFAFGPGLTICGALLKKL